MKNRVINLVLADSSVWIDHLRARSEPFQRELNHRHVLMHDFVLGELALGNLGNRPQTLESLRALPFAMEAHTDEVLELIESNRLFGRGVGWIDAHLLASVRLQPGLALWTRDKRLFACAQDIGLPVAGLH